MKILISEIQSKKSIRPEGYIEEIMALGHVEGEYLVVDKKRQYFELFKKYSPATALSGKSCCGNSSREQKIPQFDRITPQYALPPVTTQVKNAFGAATRVLSNIVNNHRIMAEEDVILQRKSICESCEFWLKDKQRCTKCGCYTALKIKLSSESCPIKKW